MQYYFKREILSFIIIYIEITRIYGIFIMIIGFSTKRTVKGAFLWARSL